MQRYCCLCIHSGSTSPAFEIQPSEGLFGQNIFSKSYGPIPDNEFPTVISPSINQGKLDLSSPLPPTLNGTNQSETLRGTNGNDSIYGLGGDDQISLFDGDDYADGGDGNDSIFGGNGNDTIDGGNGDDNLNAGGGADTLRGGAGNDTLTSRTSDMASSFDDGGNTMEGGRETISYTAGMATTLSMVETETII